MPAIPPKWPHTLNWPWSPTKHRDDSTHRVPETFVGPRVVITEKLDGGNTCLYRGEVYARSVAAPSRDGWMAMVRKYHAWKLVTHPFLILNGEDLFGIHSIQYTAMRPQDTFRLFSVRHPTNDDDDPDYLIESWDEIVRIASNFDMLTVPVLFDGTFDSVEAITAWFDAHLREPSTIGGVDREGFVIRLAGPIDDWEMDAAKYIRPKHVQTDEHWKVNWQPCPLLPEGE